MAKSKKAYDYMHEEDDGPDAGMEVYGGNPEEQDNSAKSYAGGGSVGGDDTNDAIADDSVLPDSGAVDVANQQGGQQGGGQDDGQDQKSQVQGVLDYGRKKFGIVPGHEPGDAGKDAQLSLLQNYRRKYDRLRTHAAAALSKNDLVQATTAANMSYPNMLDGEKVQFAPAQNGNVTATVAKGGATQALNLTPDQFNQWLIGHGSDYDNQFNKGATARLAQITGAGGPGMAPPPTQQAPSNGATPTEGTPDPSAGDQNSPVPSFAEGGGVTGGDGEYEDEDNSPMPQEQPQEQPEQPKKRGFREAMGDAIGMRGQQGREQLSQDGAQAPGRIMQYLQGEEAAPEHAAATMEQRADPDQNMEEEARKFHAVMAAGQMGSPGLGVQNKSAWGPSGNPFRPMSGVGDGSGGDAQESPVPSMPSRGAPGNMPAASQDQINSFAPGRAANEGIGASSYNDAQGRKHEVLSATGAGRNAPAARQKAPAEEPLYDKRLEEASRRAFPSSFQEADRLKWMESAAMSRRKYDSAESIAKEKGASSENVAQTRADAYGTNSDKKLEGTKYQADAKLAGTLATIANNQKVDPADRNAASIINSAIRAGQKLTPEQDQAAARIIAKVQPGGTQPTPAAGGSPQGAGGQVTPVAQGTPGAKEFKFKSGPRAGQSVWIVPPQ